VIESPSLEDEHGVIAREEDGMTLEADVSRVERWALLDQLGRTILGIGLQLRNDGQTLHVSLLSWYQPIISRKSAPRIGKGAD
jgi:hypothetical protein